MTGTLAQFNQLSDAEEYFEFFQLSYDPQVVNVNRLHILKKFSGYMQQVDANSPNLSDEEKLSQYCQALQQAYEVFLSSSGVEQKLFKVFKDKPKNVVLLTDISSSN
ncbi:MAG TPA: nitrogenase stabilizing/protective protein [Cyanobacteria bacterium UBA8553]|nr:nitrogenase stabilizing/protective protein [Cyanobacteria bacterium UBA8553]HAJ57908.1 nitrogenase stabilizing/protective protein [Cyanobacteria bacterium UBA8543]